MRSRPRARRPPEGVRPWAAAECPRPHRGPSASRALPVEDQQRFDLRLYVVGARRIELLASSTSRKRSPTELRARAATRSYRDRGSCSIGLEAVPGIEPGCRVLQTLA